MHLKVMGMERGFEISERLFFEIRIVILGFKLIKVVVTYLVFRMSKRNLKHANTVIHF